jgi:hypothetical protein
MIAAFAATTLFAFVYFIGAIPAGERSGLPLPVAALAAWFGYSLGAVVVAVLGGPARAWLQRTFRISTERNPRKLFWRVWERCGIIGLGLIAPVTIGPQGGVLLGLALGERPVSLTIALCLGVVPWCILIAVLWGAGIGFASR